MGESLSFIGLISIRLSFVVAVAVVLSVAGNCLDKEEFMAPSACAGGRRFVRIGKCAVRCNGTVLYERGKRFR